MLHIINRCSFFEPLALVQALCPPRPRARPLEACENTPPIDINETVTRQQVSGAAEPGSSVVDTAVRELMEEVSVEVATSCLHHISILWSSSFANQVDLAGFAPRYLGGHHQPRSRHAHFNDNCVCIALRARSTAFAPDMHEVYKAKWASAPLLWENRRRASLRLSQEPIAALADIAQRYTHCPPPPSVLIDGHTLLHDNERSFPAFSLCGHENPTTLGRQPSFHTSSAP